MGTSHSVYFANASDQDVYVIASLNPYWAIADFITDIALLAAAVGEIKAVVTTAELPEAIVTLTDLYNFVKIAALLLLESAGAATRPIDAAFALIDAFKKVAKQISSGDYKDVYSDNMLNYLNADGIAAVLGADTVSLMVMSGDAKQLVMWNAGSDQSWIATSSNKIVRSKYGSIWQQDPDSGSVDWPVLS